jgi:hypothetical protein
MGEAVINVKCCVRSGGLIKYGWRVSSDRWRQNAARLSMQHVRGKQVSSQLKEIGRKTHFLLMESTGTHRYIDSGPIWKRSHFLILCPFNK